MAAKGKRISGIYIPITLDTSAVQGDLQKLASQLGTAGDKMQKAFSGNLGSHKLVSGFIDITRAMGTLRDSARAIEQLKPLGSFQNALQAMSPELRKLGQSFGLSIKAQQELLTRMAENQAINQQVNALRTLERTLGATREETVKLAQSYGMAISQMAKERFLGNTEQQLGNIHKLAEEYRKLSKLAGQAATPQGFTQYANMQKIREAVNAFKQLNPQLELTRKYYSQIAQAAGVATSAVAAYMRLQQGGRGIWGIFSPSNMTAGVQSAMGAAGVVGGMYGVVELAKSAVNASIKMENLTKSFESIYNSSEKADSQLKFIRQTCDKLGLSFAQTAEGAKGLFASAQGTILEHKVNKIYTAFANAGAALKLTGDQLNGIFLAVNQVLSKNQVMAEELKLQIGERLPGAVALFAKSIGVSTKELSEMMTKGQVGLEHFSKFVDAVNEKYKMGAENASQALQKQINRLGNEWFDLKRKFVDSDALAAGVKSIAQAVKFLSDNADGISKVVSNFIKFVALTAAIMGVASAITTVKIAVVEAGGVVAAATATFTRFGAALGAIFTPVRVVSAAVAGLILLFSNMEEELSPAEKAIKKFTAGFDEAAAKIELLNRSYEELTEKQQEAKRAQLEMNADKAFKEAAAFFNPQQIGNPVQEILDAMEEDIEAGSVDIRSGFQKMFDDMKAFFDGEKAQEVLAKAQKTGEEMWQKLSDGVKKNASAAELTKIWDDAISDLIMFQRQLQEMDATDQAIISFQKLQLAVNNAAKSMIEARKPVEDLGGSSDELKKVEAAAQTAAVAIGKITKGTEQDKAAKLAQNFGKLTSGLWDLSIGADQAKGQMEKLGESVDHNSDQWKRLEAQVKLLDTHLPQVASYAIKNGKSFDAMAESIYDAGVQAGYTYDQLMRLHEALKVAFNVEVGRVITKELQKLDLQIAQIGAKTKDTKAFSILSQVVKESDDQLKLFNAIAQKDVKTLGDLAEKYGAKIEDFDKVIAKSELFGTKSAAAKGGGRRSGVSKRAKEAQKDLSDLEKRIEDVTKKIGAFQSKINDDPSIKYWADVEAEIKTINELLAKQGNKHTEQVQKLKQLRDEYEKLAHERFEQMKEEERRQKAINALQMFTPDKLPEVNRRAGAALNLQALEAQYQDNLKNYQKMVNGKIIAEEDFARLVEDLNIERNIKEAQANGSMLASFAAAIQKAAQDLEDWHDKVSDILVGAIEDMSDALADFVVTGMKNTSDLGEAFKSMVDGMIQDLARLFMRMIIMSATNKLFGSLFGGSSYLDAAQYATSFVPGVAAAKGGVFSGGNISNFSGRVVTGPTIFSGAPLRAFAKGGNIMGEKGPEVVLPLSKGNNGRLGVDATVGAPSVEMNQAISINIFNSADAQVQTRQTRDQNGNLDIQIMVEKMVGESMNRTGSAPFRALRGTWGAAPKLAQRG